MADILDKDLDAWDTSVIATNPFLLKPSEVTKEKYISGEDLARSIRITEQLKDPVELRALAYNPSSIAKQIGESAFGEAVDRIGNFVPNVKNWVSQLAIQTLNNEPIFKPYQDKLKEFGVDWKTIADVSDQEKIIEMLDGSVYPVRKFFKRILAESTDNIEKRKLIRELYNQSHGVDSEKWYNTLSGVYGGVAVLPMPAKAAGSIAKLAGGSRYAVAKTAENVARGVVMAEEAGGFTAETAEEYLKRTGDKTFENFTPNDASGLLASLYGYVSQKIEFMGDMDLMLLGAIRKVGIRKPLSRVAVEGGLKEWGEEILQNTSRLAFKKIEGTDQTWAEGMKEALVNSVYALPVGGTLAPVGYYVNRRNLVKGIKMAVPNITDAQAVQVADAMIDSAAESVMPDPTLRKSLRDKVSMMYETSDIENKEDTIDAITDLEYSLIVADSAERGIEIADNPLFQGEVNELGWFREGIPEERRTEIQGYINELNDLKTELKKLNEAQEKDWAKIDEIENKLDKFNRYVLDKLSDLARADARHIAQMLRETEQKFVNKEKKKKGVKIPTDVLYQPRETYDGLTTSTNVPSVRAFQNLPKEKQFRVLYDSKNKLWFLADADNMTHIDMFIKGWEQGNYPQFSTRSQAEQAFNEDYTADEQNLLRFMVKNYNTPADAKQGMEHILGTDEYNNAYLRDNTVIFARYESDLEDSGFPAEAFDHYKVEYKDDERKIVLVPNEFDLADENARLDDIYPAYEGDTIEVDGKQRTVYNSNGDRIAKSKEALTNFWKWFGDSKVVDKQGRPLVVYHGTNIEFDKFDINKAGLTTEAESSLYGFYFTDSQGIAYSYANIARPEEIIKLKKEYERLEKIAQRTGKSSDWDAYQKVYLKYEEAELNYKPTEKVYNVYLKIKNPIEYVFAGKYWEEGKYLEVLMDAKNNNNDGVIFRNSIDDPVGDRISDIYVAFEPTQIKSVDNRGTYSEDTGNIYWQNRVSGGAPSTYRGAYIPQYRFIQRVNNMDASTLSHELAHDWFEVNFARYRSGKASKDFMRAWGALEKALGVEENTKSVPRKASEAFARAYEGWIMNKTDWEKLIAVEDKDKDAIVKLMQDYQNNLRDIYQDLTSPYFKQTWGKLGELKPELVQWFDRMVNITDLDILAERGEITAEQAGQEKLNRAIDTVIENTTDPEGKKQLEYARTLNDTKRYEAEGGNKNALQRRIGALAQAIDENNMLIKENYDTHRDMLEVAKQADNFVRTRLDDALAIINGQMAEQEGLFREDIYTALERLALENGDLGLLDELKNSEIANRLAKELGQRVAGFRNWNAGEVDVASAIKTLDNKFNKALQNKKAQVQLNEAENMFKKAQEQQDKLADKQLESILNELRCK